MSSISAIRYHDVSIGHRVSGHESKCAHLHGHNYRIHFHVKAKSGLDAIGRVLDFSVIKSKLCMWLEDNWDHKFLMWRDDPVFSFILNSTNDYNRRSHDWWVSELAHVEKSLVVVDFNPTAENMAQYLVDRIGPKVLADTDAELVGVVVEETAKCSASYFKE